ILKVFLIHHYHLQCLQECGLLGGLNLCRIVSVKRCFFYREYKYERKGTGPIFGYDKKLLISDYMKVAERKTLCYEKLYSRFAEAKTATRNVSDDDLRLWASEICTCTGYLKFFKQKFNLVEE
ncbi:hypothetical protein L9F63_004397, partial [Diploptera punctata]